MKIQIYKAFGVCCVVCVHISICGSMCRRVRMQVCACAQMPEAQGRCFLPTLPTLYFKAGCLLLNLELTIQLVRPGIWLWNLEPCLPQAQLGIGAGDPSPGAHACWANTSATAPATRPQYFWFLILVISGRMLRETRWPSIWDVPTLFNAIRIEVLTAEIVFKTPDIKTKQGTRVYYVWNTSQAALFLSHILPLFQTLVFPSDDQTQFW